MDNHAAVPSEPQQYQQYYQHYQQQQPLQQQPEATNPSAYDPSTQAYYASVQQYNPNTHQPQEAQPDYSSYYYPDYSNSYQPHVPTDPNSIHPPGVTIPAEVPQTHAQNHRDVYFRHWFENLQQQNQQQQQQRQQIVYMAPGYPTGAARGGRGGKPNRGGRHGLSRGGRGGRGRGGTRGGTVSVNHIPLGVPRQGPQPQPSSSSSAPARMAWCEICKVDCNTPEVLDQHKNGKKHIKNLKVYEELQSCINKPTPQILNPAAAAKTEKQPMVSDAVADTPKDSADKAKSEERVQVGGGARGGIKRKMVRGGGRGGKLIKCGNGSRKPAETKKTVDLFCDLCNVKCESQVVFNSHMAGKKHLLNIKKLQPPAAAAAVPTLQALYPAATPSAAQQAVQDPQAALVQLLNQHGIQDAHTLLSQIIPVLLTQVLPNVTPSAQPASGEHASAAETKPESVAVDQTVQGSFELQREEETMEPPTATATTNTSSDPASVVDGRGDTDQVPEDSTKQVPSL